MKKRRLKVKSLEKFNRTYGIDNPIVKQLQEIGSLQSDYNDVAKFHQEKEGFK